MRQTLSLESQRARYLLLIRWGILSLNIVDTLTSKMLIISKEQSITKIILSLYLFISLTLNHISKKKSDFIIVEGFVLVVLRVTASD